MKNRTVGYLLIGIAVLMVIIIFLFNSALKDVITASCTEAHGDALSCPIYRNLNNQTYLSLSLVGLVVLVGLMMIFSKPEERIVVKTITEKKSEKKIDISDLRTEDRSVFSIIKENGAVFQAELIEKTGYGKAKMSRIIDRLEGRGLVERKRRGMTNVVVLKE